MCSFELHHVKLDQKQRNLEGGHKLGFYRMTTPTALFFFDNFYIDHLKKTYFSCRPAYAKWWIYQPAIYYNGKISLLVGKSIGCTRYSYVLGHFSSLEDCKSGQKHESCIILLNEKKALLSLGIKPWTFHT